MYLCTYVYMYICIYTHRYTYTCIHVFMCVWSGGRQGYRERASKRGSKPRRKGVKERERDSETSKGTRMTGHTGRKRGYVDIMHEKGRETQKQREGEVDGANRGVARLTRGGRFCSWALYRL